MPETIPTVPPPDPVTTIADTGKATSEFSLTRIAVIVGAVLEAGAGVLHVLQESGTAAPWFPAVMAIVGALLQICTIFGYQRGRALVKQAAVYAEAATTPPK